MDCKRVQRLLNEYVDEVLSARATWDVNRHLAECHDCTRVLNELRRTVRLLALAPRHQPAPAFEERLAVRIARMEPMPQRGWVHGARELFRPATAPAWGAALLAASLCLLILLPQRPPGPGESPGVRVETASVRAASQNVAISASDPLADLGTANLTAHASGESARDLDVVN